MKLIQKLCVTVALSVATMAGAWAGVLTGQDPASATWGQQSDPGSWQPVQAFSLPGAGSVQTIRWWGFHGPNSMGAGFDNFVVRLDGVDQVGVLGIVDGGVDGFNQYTLSLSSAFSLAGGGHTLSLLNDSGDVEWFWQSAGAVGNPDAPSDSDLSFRLLGEFGDTRDVPEPQTLAIALLGLAALGVSRRRAKTRA